LHLPKRHVDWFSAASMMVADLRPQCSITTPAPGGGRRVLLAWFVHPSVRSISSQRDRPSLNASGSASHSVQGSPAQAGAGGPAPRSCVARPRGFVVPSGLSVSQAQVVADITAAAEHWGVSVSWMLRDRQLRVALPLNSVNPSGPYIGVFQFLMSTFIANGGTAATIWNPAVQANIAAEMFAHGQSASGRAPESLLGASNSEGDH